MSDPWQVVGRCWDGWLKGWKKKRCWEIRGRQDGPLASETCCAGTSMAITERRGKLQGRLRADGPMGYQTLVRVEGRKRR